MLALTDVGDIYRKSPTGWFVSISALSIIVYKMLEWLESA
jgi:hypothetical protein